MEAAEDAATPDVDTDFHAAKDTTTLEKTAHLRKVYEHT